MNASRVWRMAVAAATTLSLSALTAACSSSTDTPSVVDAGNIDDTSVGGDTTDGTDTDTTDVDVEAPGDTTDDTESPDVTDPDATVDPDAIVDTDATDTPDTGDTTDGADVTPADPGVPDAELLVKIFGTPLDTSGADSTTVSGAVVALSGLSLGGAETVTWKSETTGETGAAEGLDGLTFWQAGPVPLNQGPNRIVVTATKGDKSVTDYIIVTFNPGFLFDRTPKIAPDQLFVGEPETLIVTAQLAQFKNFDASKVQIWRANEDGTKVDGTALGTLSDDGNLGNCDEIPEDGVFSTCLKNYKCTDGSKDDYFVVTTPVTIADKTYDALSARLRVECGKRVAAATCNSAQGVLKQARAKWDQGVTDAGGTAPLPDSTEEITLRDSVISWVTSQPDVAGAGAAMNDGSSIWVEFTDGFLGAVRFGPKDFRGGAAVEAAGALASASAGAGPLNTTDIRSRRALVLGASNGTFATMGGDEATDIASALQASTCPHAPYSVDGPLLDGDADLRAFRDQYLYGIIAITGHGEGLFSDLSAEAMAKYAWDHKGGQEVMWTGQPAKCSDLGTSSSSCATDNDCPNGECVLISTGSGRCVDRTQMDLRKGRVILTDDTWAVAAPFIGRHARLTYPDSLVYLGACRTLFNGTFAAEYLAAGAQAIVGFSDYVHNSYAFETGKDLFKHLVADGQLVGSAYAELNNTDPEAPHGHVRLFGATNLNVDVPGIINPSFEFGDLTGWSRDGDGRVIRKLGNAAAEGTGPVGGKFMGIVSTGLGFTTSTGEINQTFCIPAGKTQVTFYWKFLSAEFNSFCGSQFQDTFEATLESPIGVLQLKDIRVDDLCHYDESGCGTCTTPELNNCQCGKQYVGLTKADISFQEGDSDGNTYMTSWQAHTQDVTAFSGQSPVTLRLFAGDVGDSIYDTAILLDEVRFD